LTAKSPAATAAARRLWARAADGASTPVEFGAAADRMSAQLRESLGRWIGGLGYVALLERALVQARAEHPLLEDVAGNGNDAPVIAAAMREQGAEGPSADLVALVTELVELLGRIIGNDMAVQLVDRITRPSPRGIVSTETRGGRDGG